MTEREIKVFHDSFDRCMLQKEGFFDRFYDEFLATSNEVRKKFAETDFVRQKQALRASLFLIVSAVVHRSSDFSILESTARRHSRNQLDIRPELYSLWLNSLVRTVEAYDDAYSAEVEHVWRKGFEGAIDYLVTHYHST